LATGYVGAVAAHGLGDLTVVIDDAVEGRVEECLANSGINQINGYYLICQENVYNALEFL